MTNSSPLVTDASTALQTDLATDRTALPVVETPRSRGKFVPGQSGNPKGRAKGSRNNITIRRLETEEALRNFLAPKAKAILAKAVEMALDGNEKMLTCLLDKTLSSLRNEDVGEQKDMEVKVQINNLTAVNRDRVEPVQSLVRILPANPKHEDT